MCVCLFVFVFVVICAGAFVRYGISGCIFQMMSAEIGQKGYFLSQKTPIIPHIFHQRFACAHKTQLKRCTIYSVILTAFFGHFKSACFYYL